MTEVWFRNPAYFIRELVETNSPLIVWDRGILIKKRIDAYRFTELYFGVNSPFRTLLVGEQGTVELQPGYDIDSPKAVYPTWSARNSLEELEELLAHPVGEDSSCYNAPGPPDEVPVEGQEHRVVIVDLPPVAQNLGRSLIRKLKELQEDYPEAILHLHGLYSYRVMFGLGFGSVDVDPRTTAANGKVMTPAGKEMRFEMTVGCPQWVTLLGMNVVDLKIPRNRCIYNIKSAEWAGANYMDNVKFKTKGTEPAINPNAKNHIPAVAKSPFTGSKPSRFGDKQLCNTCSLQNNCKFYRRGAVCSVPGAEPAGLASMFKTRDSSTIIDGLGTLLASQASRLEQGMSDEELFGGLDPEVTRIANQVFNNGVKLAKLIDPSLAKPSVQVNVGSVSQSNPNQIMGAICRELESRGIKRQDITPEMVQGLLIEMGGAANAVASIDARVASGQNE